MYPNFVDVSQKGDLRSIDILHVQLKHRLQQPQSTVEGASSEQQENKEI